MHSPLPPFALRPHSILILARHLAAALLPVLGLLFASHGAGAQEFPSNRITDRKEHTSELQSH